MLLSQLRARIHVHVPARRLDDIQRRDPSQCLQRNRVGLSFIEIEEFPPRMRQTTQFRHPLGK